MILPQCKISSEYCVQHEEVDGDGLPDLESAGAGIVPVLKEMLEMSQQVRAISREFTDEEEAEFQAGSHVLSGPRHTPTLKPIAPPEGSPVALPDCLQGESAAVTESLSCPPRGEDPDHLFLRAGAPAGTPEAAEHAIPESALDRDFQLQQPHLAATTAANRSSNSSRNTHIMSPECLMAISTASLISVVITMLLEVMYQ
eukprot:TRINITY_DN57905_c0_g1_i1.p1 TRINITY_DN57905_c0_g1~~TRINITY_DN57905_c0_g1_i1.p1  ORF type:complete len:200 (-),score=35.73 TRINITY_DN57905_c0_g1_i1:128-727(-)